MASYRIARATSFDGSLDPQAKFIFDPPVDSDELFDALRTQYPTIKTHSERKRKAVLDFLVREREDDLRALDMLVCSDQVASPTIFTSASAALTPVSSNAEPTPESTGSGQPSPVDVAPSAMFHTKPSKGAAFQVWDPSSDKPVKLHSRRRMTDQEKEEYRMRRLLGSCDSCKQKRRKCRHFLEASSSNTKQRAKKAAKAAKASKSSNASPLVQMQSASESGSDSSPTESLTQSFSQNSWGTAMFNDPLLSFENTSFDTFGTDFPLFSEATAELDMLPFPEPFSTPAFSNTFPAPSHPSFTSNEWTLNTATAYNDTTDWLNVDPMLTEFAQITSGNANLRQQRVPIGTPLALGESSGAGLRSTQLIKRNISDQNIEFSPEQGFYDLSTDSPVVSSQSSSPGLSITDSFLQETSPFLRSSQVSTTRHDVVPSRGIEHLETPQDEGVIHGYQPGGSPRLTRSRSRPSVQSEISGSRVQSVQSSSSLPHATSPAHSGLAESNYAAVSEGYLPTHCPSGRRSDTGPHSLPSAADATSDILQTRSDGKTVSAQPPTSTTVISHVASRGTTTDVAVNAGVSATSQEGASPSANVIVSSPVVREQTDRPSTSSRRAGHLQPESHAVPSRSPNSVLDTDRSSFSAQQQTYTRESTITSVTTTSPRTSTHVARGSSISEDSARRRRIGPIHVEARIPKRTVTSPEHASYVLSTHHTTSSLSRIPSQKGDRVTTRSTEDEKSSQTQHRRANALAKPTSPSSPTKAKSSSGGLHPTTAVSLSSSRDGAFHLEFSAPSSPLLSLAFAAALLLFCYFTAARGYYGILNSHAIVFVATESLRKQNSLGFGMALF